MGGGGRGTEREDRDCKGEGKREQNIVTENKGMAGEEGGG